MGADLHARGHRILVFQQADDIYQQYLPQPRFDLFRRCNWIIDGYAWCAIPWQHEQGVPTSDAVIDGSVPPRIRHRKPGCHDHLNQFLVDHVQRSSLLD